MEWLNPLTQFLTALAPLMWPILVGVAIWKLLPQIDRFFSRGDGKVKVGEFELSFSQATDKVADQINDLQEKIVALEKKLGVPSSPSPDVPASDAAASADAAPSGPSRILWVDDYPANNAFLIENFRRSGVDVQLVSSTADALDQLGLGQYAAVISDLGRKEHGASRPLAGLELVKEMKSRNIETPILIFSGARGLQVKPKLIEAGAYGVTSSGTDVVAFVDRFRGRRS